MNLYSTCVGIVIGVIIADIARYIFGFHSFVKRQKVSWVGFDLDGTLALKHNHPFNPRVIGDPIPSMIDRVKTSIAEGKQVKIVTARVSTDGTYRSVYNAIVGRYVVKQWCKKHIGVPLEVVSYKNFKMSVLYDDCAVGVETDTGRLL